MTTMTTTPLKRFAIENGIKLAVAKAIVRAAEKVADTGTEVNNRGTDIAESRHAAAQREFKAIIKANGFDDYIMPGIYPVLIKDGVHIHLPD